MQDCKIKECNGDWNQELFNKVYCPILQRLQRYNVGNHNQLKFFIANEGSNEYCIDQLHKGVVLSAIISKSTILLSTSKEQSINGKKSGNKCT